VLKEMLQNQKHGWIMKKISRWPIKKLVARREKHKLNFLIRDTKKLQITEMNVCIHELE